MIYSNKQDSFHLTSWWQCDWDAHGYGVEWYILIPPSTDSRTVTFAVNLPFDAVIRRVWLTMGVGSPNTGSAFRRVNGISIPSSGEVELETDIITAQTTSFEAVFSFKANGAVYQDMDRHEGNLAITEPTLHVEYTSTSNPDGGEDEEEIIVTRPESRGVQLPRLLGKDFAEVARLEPINVRLELNVDPKSAAVMTLPPDQPLVQVGDFIEMFSPHESVGVFRVQEVATKYSASGIRTVQLEHAICTLEDSLAIGTQTMSAPVATVFATLLETQNVIHWVLGDCEVPEEYELIYEYSYENLLQAITKLTAELPAEYWWEFDTTRHPFVMHLRRLPQEDSCEGRLSRNLESATVTIDRTSMCTRIYPFGAGERQDRMSLQGLIGSQYLDSVTAETWGLVAKTFTYEDIYDALTLRDVAERYLEKYGTPLVSVKMDAVDLSEATGESFDRFRLGMLCRLAMPDYGVTMRERIVAIIYPDVYGQPETLDVTLANRIRDASDEIAELLREATNSKLLGGKVETIEEESTYGPVSPVSPFSQYFDITGYGNLLNVKTDYECTTSAGAKVDCHVIVDGTEVDSKDAATHAVDVTRYLASDENGVPLVGEHVVTLQPATLNTTTSTVTNTITIKQIKKG